MTNKWIHTMGIAAGVLVFLQSQNDFVALLSNFPPAVTQLVHLVAAVGVWAGIAYTPSVQQAK